MAWDDDKKAKAIDMYLEAEPTPENSMEIVQEIAEELDETANGVRMILSKAEVYIKKEPAKSKTSKSTGTRVSKEAAHQQLVEAIEGAGKEADMEIISKLTGKAALYIASLFSE